MRRWFLTLALAGVVGGHVGGLWHLPSIRGIQQLPDGPFDRRSITVAYSRVVTGGVSPWSKDDLARIMSRFVERWAQATRGRSQVIVSDETELRDVLVVFNDKTVSPPAEARSIQYAGGRLRYVEVFPSSPGGLLPLLRPAAAGQAVDVEYTAGTLLHELGHLLGCCAGPGTSGGHFVGPNCQRLLCSPHGRAQTFSDEELAQMGLPG